MKQVKQTTNIHKKDGKHKLESIKNTYIKHKHKW